MATEGLFKNRWWIVVGAVLGIVTSFGPIVFFSFGVFLRPITAEFGWDRGTVSLALTAATVVSALLTPAVGRMVDRYGIRPVALWAILLFALATAAIAFVPPVPAAFILLYAVLGIPGAAQAPLPYVKSVTGWFDDRRGLALGIALAGVGLGAAIVPQVSQRLLDSFGWRNAYVGIALITFLVAMPSVWLFIREPLQVVAGGGTAALPGVSPKEARGSSSFWYMTLSFFLASVAIGGATVHLVPLLTDRGIAPQVAASTGIAMGLSLIAGRIVAGWALDRFFAPYLAAFFFVCPLIGLIVLGSGMGGIWPFVGAALLGLGTGAEVDMIAFMAARYFGIRSFGEIYGYLFCAFSLGAASGPLLMGVSFDRTGGYTTGLAILAVLMLVSCALILRLGPYVFPARHVTPLGPASGSKSAEAA